MELLTEFTTGYWWGSWNCLPSSPRIIGGDRGTVYRIHHGLLVGVVELFTDFTTGYWWGRGTVYRVHHGLLVGSAYRVHGLLVGVVELLTEFTTGYWWGSWNYLPGSPRVISGGRGTTYRVHHGLLVGVVELFTEFTTGYWWGSAYRVHGLLVGVV